MRKRFGNNLIRILLAGIMMSSALYAPAFPVRAAEESSEDDAEEEIDYYAQAQERKNEEVESNLVEGWPEGPAIGAEGAVLMDADSGAVLYGKNIHEQLAPASTTKLMTALLAYENLSMDDMVTFSEEAIYSIEYGSSSVGLSPGEAMTVEESLYALLVASANEVAAGLGEKMAGSVGAFPEMMNKRARELGCENTHFVNANGLYDSEHYASAYDMALIAREFFSHEDLAKFANVSDYHMMASDTQPQEYTIFNKHKLINGEMEYDGVIGGKTGYTEMARQTLVTCAERDDMRLICVIFREESPDQFNDTIELFDYGFDNFRKLRIADHEKKLTIDNPGFMQQGKDLFGSSQVPFEVSGSDYVALPRTMSFEDLTTEVEYDSAIFEGSAGEGSTSPGESAPAAEPEKNADGQIILGKIHYKANGWEVGSAEIFFTGTVPDPAQEEAETAGAGVTAAPAAEPEETQYGTAHYSDNQGVVQGVVRFFRRIVHSGANGTLYLDVPALLFLIIIISAILIVVILIVSYIRYLHRRRRRRRNRRRKKS